MPSPPTSEDPAAAASYTDVSDLAAVCRESLAEYEAGRQSSPVRHPAREAALAEYRRRLTERIQGDLAFNISRLEAAAEEIGRATGRSCRDEPLIADLFRRLAAGQKFLVETDPYTSSSVEEKCWIALQQFYCDALDLAERLRELRLVQRRRWPRPLSDGAFRRHNLLGIESYRRVQTMMHGAEVAIPNVFEMRFRRTLWRTIRFMLRHQLWPWGDLHWADFEATTLPWLEDEGLGRLAGRSQTRVRFLGREYLEDNAELFDPVTRRARHNVMIAGSHRAGFLDFPLFTEMLRRVPHAVWANNAFYTPGMAKKLARERTTIPIRGEGRMPMNQALNLTISVLRDDGRALFLMADGSQPNLMYRHQVRIKRGIRVLVDECIRQAAGTGRRTYVVPMTYDDPPAYLCGLDEEIVVRAHPPLLITEPTTSERYRSVFDENATNGGDPLLNHLEALYFVHSAQPRHGLRTPDVLGAVEHRLNSSTAFRRWLRARFNTTVHELSTYSAQSGCRA